MGLVEVQIPLLPGCPIGSRAPLGIGERKKIPENTQICRHPDHPENSGENLPPWLTCNLPVFSLAMYGWAQLEVSDLGTQNSEFRELDCRVWSLSLPFPMYPTPTFSSQSFLEGDKCFLTEP